MKQFFEEKPIKATANLLFNQNNGSSFDLEKAPFELSDTLDNMSICDSIDCMNLHDFVGKSIFLFKKSIICITSSWVEKGSEFIEFLNNSVATRSVVSLM